VRKIQRLANCCGGKEDQGHICLAQGPGSIQEDRIVPPQLDPRNNRSPPEHILKILYEDTSAEQLTTLAGIEQAVRNQMQETRHAWVGVFLHHNSYRLKRRTAPSKALENCL